MSEDCEKCCLWVNWDSLGIRYLKVNLVGLYVMNLESMLFGAFWTLNEMGWYTSFLILTY
jgi:hypothetical protein